ncbi:hypothetical protein BJF78_15325 [Pseudonocardia sp. CNS-139]|nr:hypothetical protein BJF78_15325 [Pseudonocardia sp. CNS-139]
MPAHHVLELGEVARAAGSNEYMSLIVISRDVMYQRCVRAASCSRWMYSGGSYVFPKNATYSCG